MGVGTGPGTAWARPEGTLGFLPLPLRQTTVTSSQPVTATGAVY